MKRFLILFLVLLAGTAFAQFANPFSVIRHSARDANGDLHLRWDDLTAGLGTMECYYSAGTGNWNSATVNSLSNLELEALAPYTYGQKLRYRLRYNMDFMGEAMCTLHPAFWDAESFPPNLNRMAYIGTDPTGDSLMVYGPHLDLEESYMAMGPEKLYFSMQNSSGLFPTMNNLTSFNAYMATIVNPETVVDTLAYAMIYSFNIPGVLSNGLYKLRFDSLTSLPTFTRLGNIQAQVSSGTLHLACTMSDLTNDPDFGAWPNASNTLVMTGLTMAITIENMVPNLGIGDYGTPAVVVMEDNYYQQPANILPTVEFVSFMPDTGVLMLSYQDQQGDFPLQAEVINPSGTTFTAIPQGHDYSGPVYFIAQMMDAGYGEYHWNFSDNGIDVVSGVYTATANADPFQIPAAITCAMPNPVCEFPLPIKLDGLSREPLQVKIYNLRGQQVATLHEGSPTAKSLELNWNGLLNNHKLPSGLYFIAIEQQGRRSLHKFIVAP